MHISFVLLRLMFLESSISCFFISSIFWFSNCVVPIVVITCSLIEVIKTDFRAFILAFAFSGISKNQNIAFLSLLSSSGKIVKSTFFLKI